MGVCCGTLVLEFVFLRVCAVVMCTQRELEHCATLDVNIRLLTQVVAQVHGLLVSAVSAVWHPLWTREGTSPPVCRFVFAMVCHSVESS